MAARNTKNKNEKQWPLNYRLAMVMGSLFVIILIVCGSTLYTVKTQKADGLVINLAGRQRMLTQKFTKETYAWLGTQILPGQSDGELAAKSAKARQKSSELFEVTLKALRDGGKTYKGLDFSGEVNIPKTKNQTIVAKLNEVSSKWNDLNISVDNLMAQTGEASADETTEMLQVVLGQSVSTLKTMNAAVQMYQQESEAKVAAMIRLQYLMVGIGLLAFILSSLYIVRSVVRPLEVVISDLNKGSSLLSSSSNSVAHASTDMAERASTQAAHLEEAAASMEVLASITTTNLKATHETEDLTSEVKTSSALAALL